MTFVKLGTLHVRPEDVVRFNKSSAYPGRTLVKLRDGTEWNVSMHIDEVAKALNG